MNLWTKAMVLLIVTNSMASSDQSNGLQKAINLRTKGWKDYVICSKSAKKERDIFDVCVMQKWGVTIEALVNSKYESNTQQCCWILDAMDMLYDFDKKNCEVKSGYEEWRQKVVDPTKEACAVDMDKDCKPLIQSVAKYCPINMAPKKLVQSLALIVVSFVTTFIFY